MTSIESTEQQSLSPEGIREIAYAFQKSRVLLTAYELNLFSVLGDGSRSSGEIAAALGTDPRATDRLMNALCAIGLLTKKTGTFANTPASSSFLVQGKTGFMAGLLHTAHLWDTWSDLTESVRLGRAPGNRDVDDRGKNWLRAFIAAMHDRGSKQAPTIVAQIDCSGVSRVLDVGGGSGAYAMAFVRSGPDIRATVFDLPNVLPLTREYIEREGLSGKVGTVAGNYLNDDLGNGFDIVFLSAIVHSNSDEQNRLLVKKCARAIRPGGRVIVQDFIMDEERTSPEHGAMFALNMLVGTDAGDTYTESEVRAWMEAAGLTEIMRKETPSGVTQIIGRRSVEKTETSAF
jgi:ubiquinone/menaquinone biosynthesis C-methylase UbiE